MMANTGNEGVPLTITNEMVAQFMLNQQTLNERLQESTDQMNARLQALLAATGETLTTGTADNVPTPSTRVTGQETTATNTTRKPKHTTTHPERFTGEDESLYPIFRGLLEAKLRTDAQAIGGEYEQVWYAFGRLADTASKRIFPWVQHMQNGPDFTVDCLLTQMDLAFLDQQKQSKAVAKINTIKQRNRSFREFLQEFDQTLMEANGWGWQEEVKKGLLKAALAGEVRRELVGRDEPATYSAYVAQIRKITDDLNEWKDEQKSKARFQKPQFTAQQQSQHTDEKMDWEPTRTAPVATARTSQAQQGQSKPRAKWVSQQEMTRRKESGECLRCGSNEHFIGQCHLGAARRPDTTLVPAKKPKVRTAAAKAKKSAPALPTAEELGSGEESGSDYGSENE
jgi:Retrotransposon gag protein